MLRDSRDFFPYPYSNYFLFEAPSTKFSDEKWGGGGAKMQNERWGDKDKLYLSVVDAVGWAESCPWHPGGGSYPSYSPAPGTSTDTGMLSVDNNNN